MLPERVVPAPPVYPRPPIIQRVATVWSDLSEDRFLSRFDLWNEVVSREFPHYEPFKEWIISVDEKEGVPLYDTFAPELKITHRFSRKSDQGRREVGMSCPVDALALHLFTKPGVVHGYPELAAELSKWLPSWFKHFEVGKITRCQLSYINVLNPLTVSPFIDGEGLQLIRVLNTFLNVPGTHKAIVPPYDCQATVLIEKDPAITLTYRVFGEIEDKDQPSVHVEFVVNIISPQEGFDVNKAVLSFQKAHDAIINRFELVFTDEVKAYFATPIK